MRFIALSLELFPCCSREDEESNASRALSYSRTLNFEDSRDARTTHQCTQLHVEGLLLSENF